MKTTRNISIDIAILSSVKAKLGNGNFSGLVEKLLKKWLKSPDKKAQ